MVLAILWCADAFAHGDGKCQEGMRYRIAHFEAEYLERSLLQRDCAEKE